MNQTIATNLMKLASRTPIYTGVKRRIVQLALCLQKGLEKGVKKGVENAPENGAANAPNYLIHKRIHSFTGINLILDRKKGVFGPYFGRLNLGIIT